MKSSEFIRMVAGMIDAMPRDERPARPQLLAVTVDNTDETESEIMVPPLQATLELLKKTADVDSFYDEGGVANSFYDEEEIPDELELLKKNAGIINLVTHRA